MFCETILGNTVRCMCAFEHCPQMDTRTDFLKMPVDAFCSWIGCSKKSFKYLPDSNLTTKKKEKNNNSSCSNMLLLAPLRYCSCFKHVTVSYIC